MNTICCTTLQSVQYIVKQYRPVEKLNLEFHLTFKLGVKLLAASDNSLVLSFVFVISVSFLMSIIYHQNNK